MNIVFLDQYSLGDADLSSIRSLGNYKGYDYSTPEQVVERAQEAEVIITNKVNLFEKEISALPKLRLICVSATGTNNVDIPFAASRGIAVKNAIGYSTQSVAEATFGFVLSLLRQTAYYDAYVKSGQWTRSGRIFHLERSIGEIKGKTWGIIGMGHIGKRVAELAAAFGARVIYYSTSGGNTDAGYENVSFEELLKSSDIVSVHAPLNDQTKNLIDYSRLSLMKPTAILVNLGRGGIVHEADLARALNEGKLAGAGLDVFSNEPIEADSPLLGLNDPHKLIAAPHSGWSSAGARKMLVEAIAENITRCSSCGEHCDTHYTK